MRMIGSKSILIASLHVPSLLALIAPHSITAWTVTKRPVPPHHRIEQIKGNHDTVLMSSSLSATDDDTTSKRNGIIRTIGVCGGIGSGKSAACKILVNELSCLAHIDSDKIAHRVYDTTDANGNNLVVQQVVDAFGSDVIAKSDDDSDRLMLDRAKLGGIVFSDIESMRRLERIVWPHVLREIKTQVEEIREAYLKTKDATKPSHPVIIVEAAVLLDAGWQDDKQLLDEVWVVQTPHEIALERLQQHRNLSLAEAEKRIEAQQQRRGVGNLQEEVDIGVVSTVLINDKGLGELKELLSSQLQNLSND